MSLRLINFWIKPSARFGVSNAGKASKTIAFVNDLIYSITANGH
jgi:hypothetical protein